MRAFIHVEVEGAACLAAKWYAAPTGSYVTELFVGRVSHNSGDVTHQREVGIPAQGTGAQT